MSKIRDNKITLSIEDFTVSHWDSICEELGVSSDCEIIELVIKSK